MKKSYKFLIFIFIIGISLGLFSWLITSILNKQKMIEVNNIQGKYSEVKIIDAQSAMTSLEDVKEELGIASVTEELVEDSSSTNDVLNTYRLKQIYQGLEVYNSGVLVYADKEGNAKGVINKYYSISDFDITPKHTADELQAKAIEALEYEDTQPLNSQLIIFPLETGTITLAYKYEINIGIATANVIISDETSEVLDKQVPIYFVVSDDLHEFYNGSQYIMQDNERNIQIYLANNTEMSKFVTKKFTLYSWDTLEEALSEENSPVIQAMNTAQKCYDYYKNQFNYLSFNQTGDMKLKIVLGMQTSNRMYRADNACYANQQFIVLGNENLFNDQIEVFGHEYTHGIFDHLVNISDNNIEGQALNEAYADIMGMCLEAHYENKERIDGVLCEEIPNQTRNIKESSNRYLENKSDYGLTKSEHQDSTIISRAAYLMSEYLTREEFEDVWFTSISLLFNNPDFYDCRYAVVEAAKGLNLSEEKIERINEAFNKVGITKYYMANYILIEESRKLDFGKRVEEELQKAKEMQNNIKKEGEEITQKVNDIKQESKEAIQRINNFKEKTQEIFGKIKGFIVKLKELWNIICTNLASIREN
mgnify:FL=1